MLIFNEVKKMNVYDNANELARAMRESHEFKKLKEATAVLNKDENAKKMVNEFLSLNQDAMQYLNSFMRFQMMLADVTNSIQDVVKEAMGEK